MASVAKEALTSLQVRIVSVIAILFRFLEILNPFATRDFAWLCHSPEDSVTFGFRFEGFEENCLLVIKFLA